MRFVDLGTRLRRGWSVLADAAHSGLAGFGLLALAFLVLDGGRYMPMNGAQAGSVAVASPRVPDFTARLSGPVSRADVRLDPQQRALADHLARRYRVALGAVDGLVSEAFAAGAATGLDPLLILAMIAVESSFNPIAESDFGAKGLMQVVPRFHLDKLAAHGGEDAILHPGTNILVGAQILRDYVRRAGTLEEGLQLYAGAAEDPGQTYAQKVLAERRRLRDVVARVPRLAADA